MEPAAGQTGDSAASDDGRVIEVPQLGDEAAGEEAESEDASASTEESDREDLPEESTPAAARVDRPLPFPH